MLYYMVEFNPCPGIKRKQITQAYRKFVNHLQKSFPEVKFAGFFARDILLGTRPQYFALWEMPDYATLDTWKRHFSADKEGRKISEELNSLGYELGRQDGVQDRPRLSSRPSAVGSQQKRCYQVPGPSI